MVEFTHVGPEAATSDAEATSIKQGRVEVATDATGAVVVTDAKGRQLTLRDELTFLQQMDLTELAGKNRADNEIWMTHVTLAARIAAIDGVAVPFPRNDPTLRGMLQRVDFAGVAAVGEYLVPGAFSGEEAPPPDEAAQAKN